YTIEIASDAGFTQIVDSATVTGTTYTTQVDLSPETQYYWRVSGANVCGEGALSPVFVFTTLTAICSSPALEIPDNDPDGVNDSAIAAVSGTLTDLDVLLDVSHGFIGDLTFRVTHVETG